MKNVLSGNCVKNGVMVMIMTKEEIDALICEARRLKTRLEEIERLLLPQWIVLKDVI